MACGHSEFSYVSLHMYVTAVTAVMQLSPRAHRRHGYVITVEEAKEKRVKAGKLAKTFFFNIKQLVVLFRG